MGRPVHLPVPGPKVEQGKPVAGGLRRRFAAEHLAQVPVIELVAVEETQHLRASPKLDRFRKPLESDPGPWLAPGSVVDALTEGAKRLGELEGDQPVLVGAKGGQVRRPAVAQRGATDLVAGWGREVPEPAPQPLDLHRRYPRADRRHRP